MLALVLVAFSVGLSNLAFAMGIGAGGVDRATRWRVGITFGLFEAGMPVVGLLIGHRVADAIGRHAHWLAGGSLIAVGGYMIVSALRSDPDDPGRPARGGIAENLKLGLSALALSVDNLVAGFALGSNDVDILTGAIVFGAVSVTLSLAGLEFGARIGQRAGQRGELIGGLIVLAVGLAVGFGALG